MRMFLIAGLAIAAAPPAAAPAKFEPAKFEPAKFAPPKAECPRTVAFHHTIERGKAVAPRKLNELPAANQYAAVYRKIGGCEVPLVVRYKVGG